MHSLLAEEDPQTLRGGNGGKRFAPVAKKTRHRAPAPSRPDAHLDRPRALDALAHHRPQRGGAH
ncbi:MAG: hypothetical protein ACT6UH_26535, partial [Hydrogenophaga sp.]|uniref:hypothetical protein n=1 Tax=Hydrogenophaga sp. TaxID=1904254 RepID=UPI00403689AA